MEIKGSFLRRKARIAHSLNAMKSTRQEHWGNQKYQPQTTKRE